MRVGSVTARYAGALFELAREKGVLDQVQRDAEFLREQLADDAVRAWLFDAGISLDAKRQHLEKLGPHMHELSFNLVRLLIDKRRLDVLPEMADAFRRCVLAERGAVEGVVESARPLEDGELQKLAASLGKKLGKEVLLTTRTVPELLAGVRVLVDNKMIDVSAQGRLQTLRSKLLGARLSD